MTGARGQTLRTGTVIGAKYRIEGIIGEGGFGAVYRAVDVGSGARAAIKVLSRQALEASGGLGRFRREADLASRLKHPNTVRVLGAGEDEQGLLFIAFELLEGKSLEELLRQSGGLSLARTVWITGHVLAALEEAHALAIVHRDLKPGNIFIARTPAGDSVKVLDFGIAKHVTANTFSGLTLAGTSMGTPIYMSREQILGEDVSPRSDLFSLGIVVAEMLLGVSPYGANPSNIAVVNERLGKVPVPLPPDLEATPIGAFIRRATQAIPADRYASAGEMRLAIGTIDPGSAVGARKPIQIEIASAHTEVQGPPKNVAGIPAPSPSNPNQSELAMSKDMSTFDFPPGTQRMQRSDPETSPAAASLKKPPPTGLEETVRSEESIHDLANSLWKASRTPAASDVALGRPTLPFVKPSSSWKIVFLVSSLLLVLGGIVTGGYLIWNRTPISRPHHGGSVVPVASAEDPGPPVASTPPRPSASISVVVRGPAPPRPKLRLLGCPNSFSVNSAALRAALLAAGEAVVSETYDCPAGVFEFYGRSACSGAEGHGFATTSGSARLYYVGKSVVGDELIKRFLSSPEKERTIAQPTPTEIPAESARNVIVLDLPAEKADGVLRTLCH